MTWNTTGIRAEQGSRVGNSPCLRGLVQTLLDLLAAKDDCSDSTNCIHCTGFVRNTSISVTNSRCVNDSFQVSCMVLLYPWGFIYDAKADH